MSYAHAPSVFIHSSPSLPLSVPHQFTRLTTARTVTGSPFVSELSRSHHPQSPQYYQSSPQYYHDSSPMAPAWHHQPQPPHEASAATKSHTSSSTSTSQYSSSMRNQRQSHRREYKGESSRLFAASPANPYSNSMLSSVSCWWQNLAQVISSQVWVSSLRMHSKPRQNCRFQQIADLLPSAEN